MSTKLLVGVCVIQVTPYAHQVDNKQLIELCRSICLEFRLSYWSIASNHVIKFNILFILGSLCVILHKHITVIFFIKINLWLSYSYETYKNTKQIQLCYRKQFNSIFSGLDPKGLKGNSHRLRKFLNRNQFSN